MGEKKKKSEPFKRLRYEKSFSDFNEFYDENKTEIYKTIVELFENFSKTRKKTQYILISAKILDIEWETDLSFNKDEHFLLYRDVLPYFEKIEDYEMCGKVINTHKSLSE